jgi:hypothetical protein
MLLSKRFQGTNMDWSGLQKQERMVPSGAALKPQADRFPQLDVHENVRVDLLKVST